jgi:hypothetical protein
MPLARPQAAEIAGIRACERRGSQAVLCAFRFRSAALLVLPGVAQQVSIQLLAAAVEALDYVIATQLFKTAGRDTDSARHQENRARSADALGPAQKQDHIAKRRSCSLAVL